MKIVDTCFPTEHRLNQVLNRNTFKVSYSTMPNFKQIFSKHNIKTVNRDKLSRKNSPVVVAESCSVP